MSLKALIRELREATSAPSAAGAFFHSFPGPETGKTYGMGPTGDHPNPLLWPAPDPEQEKRRRTKEALANKRKRTRLIARKALFPDQ